MRYVAELLKVIVILTIVIIGIGVAQAWTGPTATPPAGNVGAPINITSFTQEKNGIFGSHGFYSLGTGWFSTSTRSSWPPARLTLGVNGAIGAKQYCDDNGTNCFTTPNTSVCQTGINVDNNTWYTNTTGKTVYVVTSVSASPYAKALNGYVRTPGGSMSSAPTSDELVVSQSGTDRLGITFLVPPNYLYQMASGAHDSGGGTGNFISSLAFPICGM